jgi:hypothetical protein
MKQSSTITIGHGISEDGRAMVILRLDDQMVCLSADGAEEAAYNLHTWAQHAKTWKSMKSEDRTAEWAMLQGYKADGEAFQWPPENGQEPKEGGE